MTRGGVVRGLFCVAATGCAVSDPSEFSWSEEDGDEDAGPATILPGAGPARIRLGDPVTCAEPEPAGPALSFRDVTEDAGVGFVPVTPEAGPGWVEGGANSLDIESLGGLVVADLDGDLVLDLVFTDSFGPVRFFLGDGSFGFHEVPSSDSSLPGPESGLWLQGASVVDLEGDGDMDLYLLNREDNRLYMNDGAGHFSDVAATLSLGGGVARSLGASWLDFDSDGDLDVFVANHGQGTAPGTPEDVYGADRDAFFVRQDDGRFQDQIDDLFPWEEDGYGFAGGWFDADGDGLTDLFVVNDLGTKGVHAPNVMIRNQGATGAGGWQWETQPYCGLALPMLSMGLAVGDMDNDMDFDVHVSNAGAPMLARNDGDLLFTDISLVVRDLAFSPAADISFSTNWFDHDNDGWQELHTTFSHMPSKGVGYGPDVTQNAAEQPDQFWLWDPDAETYEDIAPDLGIDDPGMNHAAVVADLDRNGFLDIVIWGLYTGPLVYTSGCNSNSWIEVHLEMPGSGNLFALGARVEVWADGEPWQLRQVASGLAGDFSGGPPEVHFGTGQREQVDLVVRWPDGSVTVNEAVPTRREVWLSL